MKFKCRSPTLTNKIQNKWDKYWKANWIFICEAKVKRMEDWAGGWALPRIVAQRNFVHLARGNKKSWVREKDKGSRVRLLFEQHSILCQNGHGIHSHTYTYTHAHTRVSGTYTVSFYEGGNIFAFYVRQIFVLVCETCWFSVITIVVLLLLLPLRPLLWAAHSRNHTHSRATSWPPLGLMP